MHPPIPAVAARSLLARLRRSTSAFACVAFTAALIGGCGGSADAPPPPESVVAPPPPAQTAPAITQQPSDNCVMATATATFTAAASGTPTPTVQWQRSSDAGATWTVIAGATAATFTTPATAVSDDGERFRAVFANAAGTATSNAGGLTIESAAASRLTVLAGNIGGPGNLDGCSTAARFRHPEGVAVDGAGNIYVADTGNQLIRKITTAGVVSTLAGQSGVKGGDDGAGSAATFSDPTGIAVDAAGNVYVTDASGSTLRKITPTGVVSTLAGSFGNSGSANGQGAAASFDTPLGLAFDSAGNLYIADQGNSAIRKVTPAGVVSTFAALLDASSQPVVASGLTLDGAGNVYVGILAGPHEGDDDVSYDFAQVWRYTPSGAFDRIVAGSAPGGGDGNGSAAGFDHPVGLAADATGNVYVADICNNEIRKITPTADVTTLAGSRQPFRSCPTDNVQSVDGVGAAAGFNQPSGVAIDPAGNVVVADAAGDVIRRVAPNGAVTTVAGATTIQGSADGSGTAATFFLANDGGYSGFTAIDAAGNIILTDTENEAVRKITPAGVVSTIAPPIEGFGLPEGVAIDAAGNIYISNFGGNEIVKITPAGVTSTLARNIGPTLPWGAAIDAGGNLYITEPFANIVLKVTPAGIVQSFAGSAAEVAGSADGDLATARFSFPQGIAIDGAGNLYVADTHNNAIRKITPAGNVTTLAGSAGAAGSADGTGAAARFDGPDSVAVDTAGNVYVADTGNNTIRKITPAGVTTTLIGVAGEVGVRVSADPRLSLPQGISVSGNQLFFLSANAVFRYDLP